MSRVSIGPALLAFAGVLVVAVVVAGVLVIGTPSEERHRRADQQRLHDLQKIADSVDTFWTREQRLPASIAELQQSELLVPEPRDPESDRAYEYRVVGGRIFEVCAEFAGLPDDGNAVDFWTHGIGRQCFRPEAKNVEH